MNKFFSFLFVCLFLACGRETWYRTPDGLRYHIISANPDGRLIQTGAVVKIRFTEKLKDSIIRTTEDNMPFYQPVTPGLIPPYSFAETLGYGLHEGDSVISVRTIGELLKKGLIKRKLPGLQDSDEITTAFRIVRVFPFDMTHPGRTDSLLKADKREERGKLDRLQAVLGPQRVAAWLEKNHSPAKKTPAGTWVNVLSPGDTNIQSSGVYLKFRLSNLSGKVLDSNIDTSFHHRDTLWYRAGDGHLPPAVDKTLAALGSGAHAFIYIPAMLGFGGRPSGPNSLVYDDLIMEVYILSNRR